MQRSSPFQIEQRVGDASQSNPEQRDGKDQPERECRPAEEWAEHPIPNNLHQKECEPNKTGGD